MGKAFLLGLRLFLRSTIEEVACRVSSATASRIVIVSIAYNTVPSGLEEEKSIVSVIEIEKKY